MRPKMSTRLLAVGLAALFLVTVLPIGAQAQGTGQFPPEFTIKTPTMDKSTLKPDIDIGILTVPWSFSFKTQGTQLSQTASPSGTIQWEPVNCDKSGVIVSGAFSETFALPAGQATSVDGTSKFNVEVTQDAPGESSILCTVRGKVTAIFGSQVPETGTAQAQFPVKAAFLGLLSVNVPTTIKQAGPQKQIRYDLEISNLGNSRTDVLFTFPEGTDPTKGGWKPVPPTKITLESTAQGGSATTSTVGFLVSTPFKNGWNNEETTMTLEVTPTSTKDTSSVGQVVQVNILARVRGVYVPTLEPILMVGAVLASAMVARMARQDEE